MNDINKTPRDPSSSSSPLWGSTMKLVVGLTLASLTVILLIYFRTIVGYLLIASIIIYLLHPVAKFITQKTRLSWRWTVSLLFLFLLIVFIGLSTATGLVVIQQIQSLIGIVQDFLTGLPQTIQSLQSQKYTFGPFVFDLGRYLDLNTLGGQLIQFIQPMIGRAGSLVSTFATGAASTIGWTAFIWLVSYFTLSDIGQIPDTLQFFRIPGYDADIMRMTRELGRIWNAFLRGQIIIVSMVFLVYTVEFSALGLRYAAAIAILAGLARFVPYVGPAVNYIVTFLVAFFQPQNYLQLDPLLFTVIIIGVEILTDQIFDNLVSPRIMGETLGVNPGAVLVVAILAANLIGLVGLLLAAPVLASAKLVGTYIIRKLFDLDPWPEREPIAKKPEPFRLRRALRRLQARFRLRKP